MTATPIPRTAEMPVYGDLDVSILGEKPDGRQRIVTTWAKGEDEEAGVWQRVREEVAEGRQAYVVCPLNGESEKLEGENGRAHVGTTVHNATLRGRHKPDKS